MPTQEQIQAAINVMNDHGIDFRAPWECTLDDREQERFEALRDAIDAALTLNEPQSSGMREALEPFAKLAELASPDHRDTRPIIYGFAPSIAERLTIGDLRRAAAALSLTRPHDRTGEA